MSTDYYDYAFDSDDVNAFLPLLASEPNLIGPRPGHPDMAGSDPARFYLRVRATAPLEAPANVAVTDPAIAEAVLGVWA